MVFGAAKHGRALSSSESDPPPVGYKRKNFVNWDLAWREPEVLKDFFSLCFLAFVAVVAKDPMQLNSSLSGSGTRRVVYDDEDD